MEWPVSWPSYSRDSTSIIHCPCCQCWSDFFSFLFYFFLFHLLLVTCLGWIDTSSCVPSKNHPARTKEVINSYLPQHTFQRNGNLNVEDVWYSSPCYFCHLTRRSTFGRKDGFFWGNVMFEMPVAFDIRVYASGCEDKHRGLRGLGLGRQ